MHTRSHQFLLAGLILPPSCILWLSKIVGRVVQGPVSGPGGFGYMADPYFSKGGTGLQYIPYSIIYILM